MFSDLLCGFFFDFPLYSRAGLCLMMGLTFLWSTLDFLYFLQCWTVIPAVWVSRLSLFLVACHGHCFAFIYGLLYPFGLSFGHPRPDCFLWVSSTRLLIPHSHGLFTNFIGFPRPNNLIFIFGVHEPAINLLLS